MDENKIKTLYTLGGSYMSIDIPPMGTVTSFLDLYANSQNLNHVSLARIGATNFMIRLQIDEAIKQQADYVILSTVPSDRIDIVLDHELQHGFFELKNIVYRGYRCKSVQNIADQDNKILSDSIYNAMNIRLELSKDQKRAVQSYIADLHNASLQRQRDYYMISDGLHRLQQHGIPFLLIPDCMEHLDWSWVEHVWPADIPAPITMPNGACDCGITVTHNDQMSHNMFYETLKSLIPDWK
jgi:hypothetical protein